MKKKRWILPFLTITLSLVSLPAMAENPSVSLDKITVTANKMEENIQKVPQSISVIDEAEIDEMGLKNSMDVLDQIPSMITTPDHGIAVTFRGLKRSMFTENNPVVIYVDGVPMASSYGFDFSLINIERIEVLRGPQGTLYGKDAIGAVVNIITKAPDNTWHGKIGTEYSSWNTWQGKASINGPIMADKLFFGLSGEYNKTDNWAENEYPGSNENISRKNKHDINGYLLFTPTDRLRVRLGIDSWKQTGHAPLEKALPHYGMGMGFGYTKLSDFHRDLLEHMYVDMETKEKMDVDAQSLLAAYDFDRFKLESITTHRVRDIDGIYDQDYSANSPIGMDGFIMFGKQKLTSWTEELRLSSTNTTGLRWVGGLYMDKEKNEGINGMQFPLPLIQMMQLPFQTPMEQQGVFTMDDNTMAVFGQAMLPLGQSFELTLGGRYQRIKKEIDQGMYFIPVQGPWAGDRTGMPSMSSLDLDKTWNTFLPKAALAWFLSDKYTAYASFSQGYMPGGFNYFSSGGGADENTFNPQKSTNYEVGIKADHDTWRFNLAAFYMDITDIHIYKAFGSVYMTDNADKAHSFGAELETTWLPIKGLEVNVAVSLMKAEYDDFDLGVVKLDGKDMEGAPTHSLRLGVCYHHPTGLYGRLDVRNVGKVCYYDDVAKDIQEADGYTLVNVKLGWLYENWDIYAFVRNTTDDEYINSFKANPMLGGVAGFGNPRSMGIGLSYTF